MRQMLRNTRASLLSALFIVSACVLASGSAEAPLPPVGLAPDQAGVAGKFAYLGAYPQDSGNQSVAALPDGKLFFYGVNSESFLPESGKPPAIRHRLESGASRYVLAEPKLWDPARRAWAKVARPPECPHNSLLATTTALPDGKVLVAGGLCDRARMLDDHEPHHPHTALSLWDGASRSWLPAPSLATSRIFHTANLLKDNSVLIVGGESDPEGVADGVEPVLDAVERYHEGRVESLPPLHHARAAHTATPLADGSLLVVGGFDAQGRAIDSVELWDPVRSAWRQMPPLHTARFGHSATLLEDGRVMIAGGKDRNGASLGSVEIFQSATARWSPGRPLLQPLYEHTAIRLSNGNVLVAGGGRPKAEAVRTAMLWDKASGEWRPAGMRGVQYGDERAHRVNLLALPDGSARVFGPSWILRWTPLKDAPNSKMLHGEYRRFAVSALPDGRVLISGGLDDDAFLDKAEVYDPVRDSFSLTGRMHQARHSHSSLVLDDGSVLVAGGWVRSPDDTGHPAGSSPERWNPTSGSWSLIGSIRFDWQERIEMGKLSDGTVLFVASRELSDADPVPPRFRAWSWDPKTGLVQEKTVPVTPRPGAGIAIRPDASVLFAGGGGAQLWSSRSNAVTKLEAPLEGFYQQPRTLVLKNGNVVLADYSALDVNQPEQTHAVQLWNATTGQWSRLPPLGSDESQSLLELPDGTLVSRRSRLPPGASAWDKTNQVQGLYPQPLQLASGKLLSFDSRPPHVARYHPESRRWEALFDPHSEPNWRTPPALAPLADGRLMALGRAGFGIDSPYSAYLWDPKSDTWSQAGSLVRLYSSGQAMQLPSGRVLHLGVLSGTETVCEIWQPQDNSWTFCGTLTHPTDSNESALRPLADGRAAVLSRPNEAFVFQDGSSSWAKMKFELNTENWRFGAPAASDKGYYGRVYDEGAGRWVDASAMADAHARYSNRRTIDALWDDAHHQWAYVLPRLRGLGRDAFFLPDACALSPSPLRLFNWHTGKVQPLADPGFGVDAGSRMALLKDGTVVMAGVGRELFHRKAGCQGFAPEPGDAFLMQPEWDQGAPAVAKPSATPLGEPLNKQVLSGLRKYAYPALLALLLVGFLVWRQRSRVWQAERLARRLAPESRPPERSTRESPGSRWALRGLFLLGAAAIVTSLLITPARHAKTNASGEAAQAKQGRRPSVLDWLKERTGIGKNIPCRFVGLWSLNGPNRAHRISLKDDGSYLIEADPVMGERAYRGSWEVKGGKMIWHDTTNPFEPDINPISDEGEGHFTLTEMNGAQTRVVRIETIKSERCGQ
ncbi:kelch repeat-containing protein [Niveibacterium terrae]|uniref:Kelch repeat-containing protein n=1 Tax=Niveibacterium terrae TaxID=3373598 RepID=UPI003A942957